VRFWITKNNEVPVREQLLRQVLLAILSQDLAPGHKLPSVRAVARRHRIHANTVSAAYHDLLEQGWLESRRGSGMYVRSVQASDDGQLDELLAALLKTAQRQNYSPEDVLQRLEHRVRPVRYERILIAEREPAMREILHAELTSALSARIDLADLNSPDLARALVVALPTRAAKVRRELPRGTRCIALRLRSVSASIEGQRMPPRDTVVTIVSRSAEIRLWARAMLIAVGLDPDSLSEVDASGDGWHDRVPTSSLLVVDVVSARAIPPDRQPQVFRVIADSSIAELKQFCGL
jgi:DNA-binding transcriptional regulator YhcF (GntR family)